MKNSKGYQNRGDILIVDDELSSLRTISDMLTAEGYGVRGAPDGSTALMIVENEQPELILLDVRMPGMDGFEVCRQIKADEKSSGIPVLFLSALDETADKVKGFAAGGLDFITKPFQAEEVLARVDTHLVLSRLRKNLEEQISERTVEIKPFKHIVESTNNPIGLVDRNFIYQYVNEPYCQALKRSTNEIIGHSLPELFGRKFFETVMEPHYKRCFAGRNVNYQEWFNFPGWGRRYMDVRYYPFLEADGRIAAVVTNVHDITEIKRTEQALAEQLAFEKLTADVASQLTQTKPRQLEGAIDSILQSLGRFFKTQRAFLAQFTKDGKKLYHRRISAAEGMELPPFPFELDLAAVSPWFAQQIRMGNVINTGPALVDLPPESGDLPEQLKRVGIKSGIIVPVRVENRSIVALGLDSLDQPVEFPPPIVDRLKIVADMMGTTLHRIRAEKLIDEQLMFEDLISRLSATFIHIKASEIDKNIEHGLRIIAEFLDIECGHLLQFSRDQNEVTITHSFDREGTEHSPPGLYNAKLPWFVEKLSREDSIYFSLSTELPEEAQAEKQHLTQQGIKSALICPLTAAGRSHGAIALSALKRERQWPDKLIERFNILGEVFSNALLRKRADEKIGEAFTEIKELKDRIEQENIYLRSEIEINYKQD